MSPPNRESVAEIACDTGITAQTIYNWRSQWQKHPAGACESKGHPSSGALPWRAKRPSGSSRSNGFRWSWSGSKNLSCSDARELRKLVDHDHPELSVTPPMHAAGAAQVHALLPAQRCGHRPCGSWPGSMRCSLSGRPMQWQPPDGRLPHAREGIPISRDRVRNLMRRMGHGQSPGNFETYPCSSSPVLTMSRAGTIQYKTSTSVFPAFQQLWENGYQQSSGHCWKGRLGKSNGDDQRCNGNIKHFSELNETLLWLKST